MKIKMRKTIFTLLITSLVTVFSFGQNKCLKKREFKKKSEIFLQKKADSIFKIYERMEKYRQEVAKQGGSVSFNYNQDIYFEQNCSTTTNLANAYITIAIMKKYKELKIQITGSIDNYELKKSPRLSLKRAKFIGYIFRLNGIDKKRIKIEDAKNEHFITTPTPKGNKLNRRVDFALFQ